MRSRIRINGGAGMRLGHPTRLRRLIRTLVLSSGLLGIVSAPLAQAELPAEPVPNVLKLNTPYPGSYAVVQDFSFSALIDSSFGLVDTQTRRFKGMLSAGQFATINFSTKRQKFYVGETIHSRGVRGTRQDLIAVYDFENLALQKDIELPPRRANIVINKGNTTITSDDRFLLVFNLNPGTSVTVVDLDKEEVVNEIQTPGCSLVYPDTRGGFFMLCGNGTLMAIRLDKDGQVANRWSSKAFNDIDNDPLSEKSSRVGDTWYFVTYKGEVQPIRSSGRRPKVGKRWWLADEAQRSEGWRPAGWHGTAGHNDGLLWVGMTPNGYNGSHKDPAPEIWRYRLDRQVVDGKIELKVPALSITVSHEPTPKLLVVNIEGSLDVYDALSGDYIHSINQLGETPYMVHAIDAKEAQQ